MSFTASWDPAPPDVVAGWITTGAASLDTVPDMSHRYDLTIDYGDGRPPYHQALAMYLDGSGPAQWGVLTAYSPGTYTITVTFTDPTDSSTVSITHDVVVSPGPDGPPANDDFANATVIPVDLSPAAATLTHVNWNEATFEVGEPLIDWLDRPFGSCWFTFTVNRNAKMWFNFVNGQANTDRGTALVNYALWRQEGTGFDGLFLVMIDNVSTGAVRPGHEDRMTYNSDGLFDQNSDGWVATIVCPGTYYIELLPQSNGQFDMETHFEPLDGPALPLVVMDDQPGYGGTPLPVVSLASPAPGSVFNAEIVTENWDVGYAQLYLAHTDEHGLFAYAWVDPAKSFTDWNQLNDTEFANVRTGAGLTAGVDGTLLSYEYSYHDIGTGKDRFIDRPAPVPRWPSWAFYSENVSARRWRITTPSGGLFRNPRLSAIYGKSGWAMDGRTLVDDDLLDIVYNPDRETYFAVVPGDSEHPADHSRLVEFGADGNVINNYDFGVRSITDSTTYWPVVFLPGSPDVAYALRRQDGHMLMIDLTGPTITDLGIRLAGSLGLNPVYYDGAWRLISLSSTGSGSFGVGNVAAIFDPSDLDTPLLEITAAEARAQYPASDPTDWGMEFFVLGMGQEYTRIWFRAFYPLRPPGDRYRYPVGRGHSQFTTHLVYYDLTDNTWHDVGRIFNGFTDSEGRGGDEVQYYDVYSSEPTLLLPTSVPPLPADTLDDNVAMTARVTTQARLLVAPPGAV